MISQPTVIVTGAGASMPYGYPSGRQLVEYIVQILGQGAAWVADIPSYSPFSGLAYSHNQRQTFRDYQFFTDYGFTDSEIADFRYKLQSSRIDSIDSFLEHNPDYLKIAKFAIANVILKHEFPALLTHSQENWLRYIWQILAEKPLRNFVSVKLISA